jgi:hypothetical protein
MKTELEIDKKDLFHRLVTRCVELGMQTGVVCGVAVTLVYLATDGRDAAAAWFADVPIGGAIGSVFGAGVSLIAGVIVAGETRGWFVPLIDVTKYRRIVTIQCCSVATIGLLVFLRCALLHGFGQVPVIAMCSTCALTCVSAWWASDRITRWYEAYWANSAAAAIEGPSPRIAS